MLFCSRLCFMYTMMQKIDLHIKRFSTLFGVRMISWILSQLNILHTGVVKLCTTQNSDYPVIHHLWKWHLLVTSKWRLKIGIFAQLGPVWPKILGRRGRPPPTILRAGKIRINILSYGIKIWAELFRFITVHAFDRRTDVLPYFIKVEWSIYWNVQYLIRRKKCVLKFAAVRYLLYRCGESMLCLKYQFIIHASPVPLFVFPTA